MPFKKSQVAGYLKKAFRDLEIARGDRFTEVRFTYAYQALIKVGIALLAREGMKVRAVPGHHIRILEAMSDILKDGDIFAIGNAMRMKRNEDLYGSEEFVSEKESDEYLAFSLKQGKKTYWLIPEDHPRAPRRLCRAVRCLTKRALSPFL
ncbi:MAG: hypothetical protein HYT89_06235 [Candidatus Omnitrophica bacterium]|nr:hypothetical protein [Candidatus Omnitrophota bacterium]